METGHRAQTEIFTYEEIADAYAARVDTKPWNAEYERPAVLSVLPSLAGLNVLDAGCGSGWYAEYCAEQGAQVTAFDITPKMVELTRARLGDRAIVLRAGLHEPLDFAADNYFDLVLSPLALHYIEHWEPTLREFRRVLKPGGILVFSTHHPFADYQLFGSDSYFTTERVQDTWDVGTVWFYRRPLTAITEALFASGFVIERLVEPLPTEAFRLAAPEGYERLKKEPGFLVIRARCTQA
jgi:SAM-dependent methyltransferase